MTVPDFQSMMLPFLLIANDAQEHSFSEAVESLAKQLNLSNEDQKETLPSGQSRFENRAGWARTHLKKAGLLESTGRGRFCISARGKRVVESHPAKIDLKFLMQFPELSSSAEPHAREINWKRTARLARSASPASVDRSPSLFCSL